MAEGASALTAQATPAPAATYPLRAAGVALAWAVSAAPAILGWMRCPSAAIFHHACPGCGMTRAMWRLARGDVAGSLAMNPIALPTSLSTLLLVVALAWVAYREGSLVNAGRSRAVRIAIALLIASQAAALVVWIARSFGALGGLPPV